MAGLGDSFMLSKPGQDTEHLWVLITRSRPQTRAAIMVNVTTQRPTAACIQPKQEVSVSNTSISERESGACNSGTPKTTAATISVARSPMG